MPNKINLIHVTKYEADKETLWSLFAIAALVIPNTGNDSGTEIKSGGWPIWAGFAPAEQSPPGHIPQSVAHQYGA